MTDTRAARKEGGPMIDVTELQAEVRIRLDVSAEDFAAWEDEMQGAWR